MCYHRGGMGIYEELGVRTLVNAAGTVTNYGGSLMAPEVFEVMQEANGRFCRLEELQRKVGERIAGMLEVEAAYVTSSAAAGLLVTTAACMAGADPARITQLPDTAGMKSQVVVQRSHRLAYDQAMRLAGATFVEVRDQGVSQKGLQFSCKSLAYSCSLSYLGEQCGYTND